MMIGGNSMVAKRSHGGCSTRIVGRDDTAFAGCDLLNGMHAEASKVRQAPNGALIHVTAHRMTGVGDQNQIILVGDFSERCVVTWLPCVVHRDNSPRLVGDSSQYVGWIDQHGRGVHVRKNRFRIEVNGCVGGRDEGDRRNDDFVL